MSLFSLIHTFMHLSDTYICWWKMTGLLKKVHKSCIITKYWIRSFCQLVFFNLWTCAQVLYFPKKFQKLYILLGHAFSVNQTQEVALWATGMCLCLCICVFVVYIIILFVQKCVFLCALSMCVCLLRVNVCLTQLQILIKNITIIKVFSLTCTDCTTPSDIPS